MDIKDNYKKQLLDSRNLTLLSHPGTSQATPYEMAAYMLNVHMGGARIRARDIQGRYESLRDTATDHRRAEFYSKSVIWWTAVIEELNKLPPVVTARVYAPVRFTGGKAI